MASPNLPVNVDTTYADASDPSVAAHQQHHDKLHAIVNEFDTTIVNATAGQTLVHDGTTFKPGPAGGGDEMSALAALLQDPAVDLLLRVPFERGSRPTIPAALTGKVQLLIVGGGANPPNWMAAGDIRLATTV